MARGAWRKAAYCACAIVNAIPFHDDKGIDLDDLDPYGLFLGEEREPKSNGAMPYNPAILQAIQDGTPIKVM
jgi:hypothetical protein